MTAALDWTDPAAVVAEARRRSTRRQQGRPLMDSEPAIVSASVRAWPLLAIDVPRPRSMAREIDEQREVVKMFLRFGCRTESTSQTRRSKVALGIPDLWTWLIPIGAAGWFEVKSG